MISFMNNQFFREELNLIKYMYTSIKDGNTVSSYSACRKIIYEFVEDYVQVYRSSLADYLKDLFEKFYDFFRKEKGARLKEKSLSILK